MVHLIKKQNFLVFFFQSLSINIEIYTMFLKSEKYQDELLSMLASPNIQREAFTNLLNPQYPYIFVLMLCFE